jgi:hypothetical protein
MNYFQSELRDHYAYVHGSVIGPAYWQFERNWLMTSQSNEDCQFFTWMADTIYPIIDGSTTWERDDMYPYDYQY